MRCLEHNDPQTFAGFWEIRIEDPAEPGSSRNRPSGLYRIFTSAMTAFYQELIGNFTEGQSIIRISSAVPKRVSSVPITLKPHAV